MKIAFIICVFIMIIAVINYDKMSYKAWYHRHKDRNDGYYWGGVPRNADHPTEKGGAE